MNFPFKFSLEIIFWWWEQYLLQRKTQNLRNSTKKSTRHKRKCFEINLLNTERDHHEGSAQKKSNIHVGLWLWKWGLMCVNGCRYYKPNIHKVLTDGCWAPAGQDVTVQGPAAHSLSHRHGPSELITACCARILKEQLKTWLGAGMTNHWRKHLRALPSASQGWRGCRESIMKEGGRPSWVTWNQEMQFLPTPQI